MLTYYLLKRSIIKCYKKKIVKALRKVKSNNSYFGIFQYKNAPTGYNVQCTYTVCYIRRRNYLSWLAHSEFLD